MRKVGIWTLAVVLSFGTFAMQEAFAQPAKGAQAKAAPAKAPSAPVKSIEVPPGQSISPADTARFLAGMPPATGSLLAPLMLEPWAQANAKFFDSEWASLEARQLSKIRAFSARNLTSPQKTLFYTFSGPDFLYADAFFPKAQTYVLVGLEPVGPIPDLTKVPRAKLPDALGQLKHSLSFFLGKSFFVTSYMDQHLRQSTMPGTLPVLYVFLARAGKTIRTVEHMRLEADGSVKPLGELAPGERPRAVKITFVGADGAEQTLYYFNTDLSNGGVAKSSFLTYLATLGPGDSFIKSASYLLHNDAFASTREFLLANSVNILQDDTGVPIRMLKPEQWALTPFGIYARPIPVFANKYQKDMQAVFDQARPAPLDFSISYRWRPGQSGVVLAKKK